ncbi:MAG: S-layer homology domain-containing protein, partial [Eubacteriales bacterium]|nr:S-layer homology domain-containing protein [Eubacteriales bacterium]
GKGETLPTVKDDGTVTLPAGAVVTLPNGTTYTVTEETNLDLTSHNEHTWDAGVVTTAPSYSSTGTRTYACTICGETKTETIPALTGGGGTSTYAVSVDSAKNGSVTVSPKNASRGSTVTITVKPDSGYELDALTVTDSKGSELKLTDKGNGKYTFTMPASKVTVEVTFVEEEAPITVPTFVDVPADAYFADAVAWAVENDITNGTSATTFSPNMSCTRAQMVTFLWRAAGSPKATGNNPFTDLDSSAYYYDAVLWAIENGVTNGTSATTFSPDATVTRGQTVTFLYRANGSPAASGNSFADVSADSYYADAVAWAVAEAITNGTGDNTFSPDADCTRGQIVTFLYRDAA